jgi:hypothetical protein
MPYFYLFKSPCFFHAYLEDVEMAELLGDGTFIDGAM